MKTKPTLFLASALLLSVFTVSLLPALATKGLQVVSAKFESPFATLRTHRQGKGATTVWNVASTDGITGFVVQRTYEDPNDTYAVWEDLATISYSASRSFTYTDKDVFPGVISYRIVALMSDGSTEVSAVSQLKITSRK